MANSVTHTGLRFKLHGDNVGGNSNCSSWPEIWVTFDITFERNDPSHPEQVTWQMSNASISVGEKSGVFGYKISAYMGMDTAEVSPNYDDIWLIASKSTDVGNNWWNNTYAYNRGPITFNSTSNTVNLMVYIKNRADCMHSNNTVYCFNSTGDYCFIRSETLSIPDYGYLVHYDANGGSQSTAPLDQYKPENQNLTLSTITPTYPSRTVTYSGGQSGGTQSYIVAFNKWKCSADNNMYNPGGTYSLNQNCTMSAQWTNPKFTPLGLDDKWYTVTCNPNGGTISPSTVKVYKTELGYKKSGSSSSQPEYVPGTQYTLSENITIVPMYADPTLHLSSLPTPTKSGYGFAGWYRNAACTDKITSDFTLTSDLTIYAGWAKNPIQIYTSGGWMNQSQYAWKCVEENGVKVWKQIAHVYMMDDLNNGWVDVSEGPTPYGILNYGNVIGMRQEFLDGMDTMYSENAAKWQMSGTNYLYCHDDGWWGVGGNGRVTLGKAFSRGAYKTLCIYAEISNGAHGNWNYASMGIRYAKNGKGNTYYYTDMDVEKAIIKSNWTPPYNCNGNDPWYELPQQEIRMDLTTLTQEPFYILFHSCDNIFRIYSIWLE